MATGFHPRTRAQLFADKFSFKDDTIIAVNALDLVAELSRQEILEAQLKQLQTKYETAMAMLSYKVNFNTSEPPTLRSYDVRA
jgi:F0F1-type ATP synthase delta subunit